MLSIACTTLLSPDQRGFLLGRSILELVALCEAATGEVIAVSREAVGIFLDFANAFRTLSRRWLRLVLLCTRIPAQVVRAILYLYEDLRTLVVFGGAVVAQIDMNCGVKQGCPLSGALFASCVDGLLRRVGVVPPRRRHLFAYADDFSFVLRRLFAGLGDLLRLFGTWSRVSGLHSRVEKSAVVWSGTGDLGALQERLWSEVPESRSGRSMRTRVRMFRVWVVSLLSYKAQLMESGPRLPQVLHRATQRVTGAPWMCFNTDLM